MGTPISSGLARPLLKGDASKRGVFMQMSIELELSNADVFAVEARSIRERLVSEFDPVVRRLAKKVAHQAALRRTQAVLDEEDLYSVGILGLFDAANRFDPATGSDFRSFAEHRVRGAMLDEVRRRDLMPRRLRAKAKAYFEACRTLTRALGRRPALSEVAEVLELELCALEALRLQIEHYNAAPSEDFVVLSSTFPTPDEYVETMERVELLEAALRQLPEREQLVLDLYFRRDLTLKEIAGILEVTEGRISQLKSAALRKVRALIEDQTEDTLQD